MIMEYNEIGDIWLARQHRGDVTSLDAEHIVQAIPAL
jgi:hypothetical protein